MTANDDVALIVQEADALVPDDPERALSIYRDAYALLIKAGGKGLVKTYTFCQMANVGIYVCLIACDAF